MTETVSRELKEIKHLTVVGKYYEAIEIIESFLELKELCEKDRVRALILQSKSFSMLARFEFREEYLKKSLELSELAFSLSKKTNDFISMFEAKIWYLCVYYVLAKPKVKGMRSKHPAFTPKEFLEKLSELEKILNEIKTKEIPVPREIEALFSFIQSTKPQLKIYTIENHIWDYKETLKMLERSLQLIKGTENKEILMFVQWYKADAYSDIGDFSNAIKFYEEGLLIAEEFGNEHFVSFFLQEIGEAYRELGEFNRLFEYTTKALEIKEKQENVRGSGYSYSRLGVFYWMTGEWKKALEYSQKGYDILSEKGKRERYNSMLNNIGVCQAAMGEYDEALKNYKIAYETNMKLGNTDGANMNLGNMSMVYTHKGDLDKALELSEENLAYYERSGSKILIAYSFFRIGFSYYHKGMKNKAIENLEKALVYRQEIGNKKDIIDTLYTLSSIASEFNMIDLATKYHEKLVEVTEETEYRNVKQLALLSEAIILKNSTTSRDKVKAEVLFKQILQEDLLFAFHIQALFHLCELQLKELKETSDEKILVKVQKNSSKLIEIGTSSNLPFLIVEILWFKSQLSLLDLNVEKARELLNQALQIAEERGFNRLALKIMKAKEQLVQQLIKLEDLEEESPSISKRMDVIKIENGFKKITSSEMFQFKQHI